MEKIIEFKNVTKSYDGEPPVLDNLSLDIYENEFVTLLGPSGCGKTTLLRILGGFITADSGCDEILKDLYAVLKEENCLADADDLDISDKFDLTFTYRKRFTVKLGGADNLSVKVRFMKSIADKLSDKATGIIDVSDENYREGMFKPY